MSYTILTKNIVPNMEHNHLKLLLLGDGEVGKTSYVQNLGGHIPQLRYDPTMGVVARPVMLQNEGNVTMVSIWDTAGRDEFRGLRDGYSLGADCAIIMVSNDVSLPSVDSYKKEIAENCGDIPYIVVFSNGDNEKTRELFRQYNDPTAVICSMLDGTGVEESLFHLMDLMNR